MQVCMTEDLPEEVTICSWGYGTQLSGAEGEGTQGKESFSLSKGAEEGKHVAIRQPDLHG